MKGQVLIQLLSQADIAKIKLDYNSKLALNWAFGQ